MLDGMLFTDVSCPELNKIPSPHLHTGMYISGT